MSSSSLALQAEARLDADRFHLILGRTVQVVKRLSQKMFASVSDLPFSGNSDDGIEEMPSVVDTLVGLVKYQSLLTPKRSDHILQESGDKICVTLSGQLHYKTLRFLLFTTELKSLPQALILENPGRELVYADHRGIFSLPLSSVERPTPALLKELLESRQIQVGELISPWEGLTIDDREHFWLQVIELEAEGVLGIW